MSSRLPTSRSATGYLARESMAGSVKEVAMERRRLYIDMDNVLVDFASDIAQLEPSVRDTYEGHPDDTPGIFRLMKPMPDAVEAFPVLASVFDTLILSTRAVAQRVCLVGQADLG